MFKVTNIPDYETYEEVFSKIHKLYYEVQEYGYLNMYGQQSLDSFEFDAAESTNATILGSHGGLSHAHRTQLNIVPDIVLSPEDLTDPLISRLILFLIEEQKSLLQVIQREDPLLYKNEYMLGQTAWLYPVILMDPVVYKRPSNSVTIASVHYDPEYFLIATPTHLQLF